MPVNYRIHPDLGLVHVRYQGMAVLDDTFEAVCRYMQDADFRPGQKQFVDLSEVEGFETDYPKLLALQAKKAEAFLGGGETMIVYFAPTEETQKMSDLIARSWEDVASVVPVIVTSRDDALTVLGLSPESFDAMMARPA